MENKILVNTILKPTENTVLSLLNMIFLYKISSKIGPRMIVNIKSVIYIDIEPNGFLILNKSNTSTFSNKLLINWIMLKIFPKK